jgi:UDP-N-acetylglucosamine 4,6-dehydratase/5-epimerase
MKGKVVLVTGGTGSFGRTMVGELIRLGCPEVRIFSRDEWKQEDMRLHLANPALRFYIGDVRSPSSVDHVMDGVNLVLHAAALKQVPSCEFFPMQAVETNIVGSFNVINSAIQHDVECVVALGTDKAVYPINAMGMTKALMEKVVQSATRQNRNGRTRLCSVRYGNVMCSRGSVIPLFIRQIKAGQPITVTEPQMTRFMMPLHDSVRLVHFAFENAQSGDLFVKKSAAATLETLVATLKRMFHSQVAVQRIGLRHGEKMHEALASAEELKRATDMGEYFRIPMDDRDLNYSRFFTEGDPEVVNLHDYTSDRAELLDSASLEALLRTLPEIQRELGIMPFENDDNSEQGGPAESLA